MKTIADVLQSLRNDFGIDPVQIADIESQIDFEEIPLEACKHAITVMRAYKAKGSITHPKGLFFKIAKEPKNQAAQGTTRQNSNNPMTGTGYDFWQGSRTVSEQTCQQIMWGFWSDIDGKRQTAIDMLADCAPCLKEGEHEQVIELADGNETVGTYPLRLAQAVQMILDRRGKVSQETVDTLPDATGVPVDVPNEANTDDLPF